MNTSIKNFAPVRKVTTFPTFFDAFLQETGGRTSHAPVNSFPAVNVIENTDLFEIRLAAPGLSKQEFKVNIHDNTLVISAEKKEETNQESEKYTRKEFNYSSFKRSFTLPESVDTDKIEASYLDGILNLTLPKKEEAKPKEPRFIEIA
jgi:HSP20 family protein